MERKGGMTHGRRKSGGSPSKWPPALIVAAVTKLDPSFTAQWSRTTACFYSCIRKNFTRLYLFVSACCYLASFLRDNHTSLIRTPSCWNPSASPSPHCTPPLLASARLNKHFSTLPRPVPSLFAAHPLSQIIRSSDHPQPQKSAAAGSRPGRNATRNLQHRRVSYLHDSATS
jgi:hypothetical protein